MSDAPPLHPDVAPFAPLLGSWKGKGSGKYPDIEDFEYLEMVTFTQVGKPFIAYTQRTRDASTGAPLHAETGYLRALPGGHVYDADRLRNATALVIAQPSGIVEVHDVQLGRNELLMTSTQVVSTPTAKRVDEVTRHIRIDGDDLIYELHMAAMGHPLQFHLAAQLTRD